MRHLFLSPHPDDAVLSCGALIAELTSQGDTVDVLTIMAGDPPIPLPESHLVSTIHLRWGLGDSPYQARRREDQAAMALLGANIHFLNWRDCIYRTNDEGKALYLTDDDIFGPVKPQDPLRDQSLDLSGFAFDSLYVPLGAGNHVDHQLVRDKAIGWHLKQEPTWQMYFYEEYPYSSESDEVLHSHSGQKARLSGQNAVTQARHKIPLTLRSEIKPLQRDAVELQISAIACYISQISTFWDSPTVMAERVRGHTADIESNGLLAERLWAVE